MRLLIVSRFKTKYNDNILPFVKEQGEAIRGLRHEVDYFLVRGNYIKAVGALKAKIWEFKPDIIHAHFGLSAITAELQNEVPVVTTFHNGETLNWHVNLVASLMSLRAKHVIYVAQHIRDLSYFKAKNYSIIPCGVPMEQMCELFGENEVIIGGHLTSLYAEGELREADVVRRVEGKAFYSLNAALAVGFRVRSKNGQQFRVWAMEELREKIVG